MSLLLSDKIVALLQVAKSNVVRSINQTMVRTYFEIGRMIVEEEQKGKQRADYGTELIKELSKNLVCQFGRGYSQRNLEQMRQFYLVYSQDKIRTMNHFEGKNTSLSIPQTLSAEFKLSWSHYLKLMRILNKDERDFYEIESIKNNWSIIELQRQYDSSLFARLALSRSKNKVIELSKKGLIIESPKDVIKDPYILEFLDLPEKIYYSESDLESKIIDKLENFLLELGTGFTFVARQKRFSIDEKHFRVDLVFFNRILKSFVLIDLKIGELKHQDIGQMQMYVNYFDRFIKLEDENKTIGIILCQDKSDTLVEITLTENNEQKFASRYQTVMPSKEEFKKFLTQIN